MSESCSSVDSEEFEPEALVDSGVAHRQDNFEVKMGLEEAHRGWFNPGVDSLGKFRHLPIVESGEVIALLDIAKCLYDAIARMERAAEKGKAIAAAVEGVEKQCGASIVLTHSLKHFEIECLGLFCLQSFLRIQSRIVTVSPTDTVLMATKKMVEYGMSSAVVAVENKTRGILM
ncbi:unnamed protein product [Camellia sinensis]